MDKQATEIACDIDARDREYVDLEWTDLTSFYTMVNHTPTGVRANLPLRFDKAVSLLVDRERHCCPFLSFELHREATHLALTVTSENPDAVPVIASLVDANDTSET